MNRKGDPNMKEMLMKRFEEVFQNSDGIKFYLEVMYFPVH